MGAHHRGSDAPGQHQDGLHRVEMFGLDFVDGTSIEPIADLLLSRAPHDVSGRPVVLTPNTDLLLQVHRSTDPRIRGLFDEAWCVIPDGQPIVWASRILGTPLRFRLTGSDLFAHLWPRLVETQTPVFVLAPSDAVANGLRASHRGASTLVAPMVEPDDDAALRALSEDCARAIRASSATIAVLSLGHPRDALLAIEIMRIIEARGDTAPFMLCLGGSAEMYLGIRKRAPEWVQRLSAEWLYRFAQEPRRLFYRYFVRDLAFVPLVWREYLTCRHQRSSAARAA